MTTPDSVNWNSEERILSSDLNRMGGLSGRGIMDALAALVGGIESSPGPEAVVRKGLLATPGAGLQVSISPGEAMRFDASSVGVDSSGYLLGRSDSASIVTIDGADPVNPRVDLVYATFAIALEDSVNREILQLPDRSVSSLASFKSSRPRLVFDKVTGTPDANPDLPGVPAGAIGLWYVYVPALAVGILDAHLMDVRRRFHPAALIQGHSRIDGLYASVDQQDLEEITIQSGRAIVEGALLVHNQNQPLQRSSLLGTGGGFFTSSAEYSLYAIAAGSGTDTPVGKTITDGMIPVLAFNLPPLPDGRPSVPILYRPLRGIVDSFTINTSKALYLGTFHTNDTASFNLDGDGLPTNRDGSFVLSGLTSEGRLPGRNYWLQAPRMSRFGPSAINLTGGVPVHDGIPGTYFGGSADMATHLFAGEFEAPNTWYYVYLRRQTNGNVARGTIRSYRIVLTAQSPNVTTLQPLLSEVGFSDADYLYLGAVYNNAVGDLLDFRQAGRLFQWVNAGDDPTGNAFGGVLATFPAKTPITTIAPLPARHARMRIRGILDNIGVASSLTINVHAEFGRADTFEVVGCAHGSGDDSSSFIAHLDIPIEPASVTKRFELSSTLTGAGAVHLATVLQLGWIDDLVT